jgi:hypothetical protein
MENPSRRAKLGVACLVVASALLMVELAHAEYDCIEIDNCTYCFYGPGGSQGYLRWCKPLAN